MESPSPPDVNSDSLTPILSRLLPAVSPETLQTISESLSRSETPTDELRRQLQDCEAELLQRKLESLAEFAAGAGHEANNPLATISGRVELLLREETDPERRRALTTIGGQALRVRDMIGDVMLFARPPAPQPQRTDLDEAIREAVEKLQPIADERRCRIAIPVGEPVFLHADPHQLQIVIANLLRNSLEAAPETDGEIVIDFRRSDGQSAEFTIIDNGHGLSDLDREHLFDPFYSGRQAGRGLGFGLCKCYRIVSNHGGRIAAESSDGRTVFRVIWPLAEE